VALERRQRGVRREALGLVVEALDARGARQPVDERPQPRRERAEARCDAVRGVGEVAAEQLVAALARQRDLDVLGGQLVDQVGGQRRGVGERLVVAATTFGSRSTASGLTTSSWWSVS
jgi:hypothetical protein